MAISPIPYTFSSPLPPAASPSATPSPVTLPSEVSFAKPIVLYSSPMFPAGIIVEKFKKDTATVTQVFDNSRTLIAEFVQKKLPAGENWAAGYWKKFKRLDSNLTRPTGRLVSHPQTLDATDRIYAACLKVIHILENTRGVKELPEIDLITLSKNKRDQLTISYYQKVYEYGDLIETCNNHSDKLTLPIKTQITHDILKAIKHLHESGIAHCDVKPDNILVDENFKAVLSDLDTCASLDSECNPGSPYYCPPEIFARPKDFYTIEGRKKSDIWAAGITIYALWHGDYPPQLLALGMLQANTNSYLKNLATYAHKTSPVLSAIHHPIDALISVMLQWDSAARFDIQKLYQMFLGMCAK